VPGKNDVLWKALATGASIAAGIAARNLASAGWRRTAGGDPPANPADPKTSWGEALAWTTTVGVLVGIARLLARRSSAGLWESVVGDTPPGLEEVEA
jgi:hypothetical protein